MSDTPSMPSIQVLGVRIHTLTLRQMLAMIAHCIERDERMVVAYVNAHALNLACELPWFRAFLNRCDIVFCDGFGVKWGARWLGQHIPQRFTPPDWLDQLAALGAQQGFRLFLLGARPGVAWQAAQRLRAAHPGLCIAGVHHGYFDKTPGSPENDSVVGYINAVQPDMLLLGFGMPLQEHWLQQNYHRLQVGVALPIGAALDYVADVLPRGPAWMTDHGLEWLARLLVEPGRLWWRYLIGNPLFVWRVWQQRRGRLHLP